MSGTSLDGIDIAYIETDGQDLIKRFNGATKPYTNSFRDRLTACLGAEHLTDDIASVETDLTKFHAQFFWEFLDQFDIPHSDIDCIGFHGQSLTHKPEKRMTWQIGDGKLLSDLTRKDVVHNFRVADVAAGGQGAPLLPLYHRACIRSFAPHLDHTAIINIGGVSNISLIGAGDENNILAFDCGAGNALMDDWMYRHTRQTYDKDGETARSGKICTDLVAHWMNAAYFERIPPKSLDRNPWITTGLEDLSVADGMATLLDFTVQAIKKAIQFSDKKPDALYITGGGRRNLYLMERLQEITQCQVEPVELLGLDGDTMEAEGFAYLAVRSLYDLPLSMPKTTGVPAPQRGGVHHFFKS
jgi:anhydro-N-acetylmuramic acid kinase